VKAPSVILIAALAGLGGCTYISCKPVWEFDRLERNARKAVTGSELQAWATHLLAIYSNGGSLRLSTLGTNFPQPLRGLAPQLGPRIYISVPDDTNFPSCVQVFWGSGFLGHHGFFLGPTNFIARRGRPWQPGVYFE
jgi:hypothetical protein